MLIDIISPYVYVRSELSMVRPVFRWIDNNHHIISIAHRQPYICNFGTERKCDATDCHIIMKSLKYNSDTGIDPSHVY